MAYQTTAASSQGEVHAVWVPTHEHARAHTCAHGRRGTAVYVIVCVLELFCLNSDNPVVLESKLPVLPHSHLTMGVLSEAYLIYPTPEVDAINSPHTSWAKGKTPILLLRFPLKATKVAIKPPSREAFSSRAPLQALRQC